VCRLIYRSSLSQKEKKRIHEIKKVQKIALKNAWHHNKNKIVARTLSGWKNSPILNDSRVKVSSIQIPMH
jgi:hypothetical protein